MPTRKQGYSTVAKPKANQYVIIMKIRHQYRTEFVCLMNTRGDTDMKAIQNKYRIYSLGKVIVKGQPTKVYGHASIFFRHVFKGRQVSRLPFCLPGGRIFPKWGLLLKGRIFSDQRKLFPLCDYPNLFWRQQ